MRSSSTERRGFLPGDAGAWARLALVVALGGAALVAPAVGATGAIYTDSETVGFEVVPNPVPTTAPASAPASAPAAAPAAATVVAPAGVADAGPGATPAPSAAPEPTSSTTPQPTATPDPAPTRQMGPGGSRTPPWPIWPHHPGR